MKQIFVAIESRDRAGYIESCFIAKQTIIEDYLIGKVWVFNSESSKDDEEASPC